MNYKDERAEKEQGFSLIEILVAVVILAVSVLGIMAVLPSGYKEITSAGRMSTLNHLAQLKMDQLKATPYTASDLVAGSHPATPWRPPYTDSSGNTAFSDYSITWYVTDDSPRVGVKTIEVEAGFKLWDSSNNLIPSGETQDQRIVRLVTYVTQ